MLFEGFEKSGPNSRSGLENGDSQESERLPVFNEAFDVDPHLEADDGPVTVKHEAGRAERLNKIRGELETGARAFPPRQTMSPEFAEQVSFAVPVKETGKPQSFGRTIRKYLNLGLVALGLIQGGKLYAEGTNDIPAAAASAKTSAVPVFNAPDQAKNTNAFVYGEQKVWQPKTPEEKAAALKAKIHLEQEKIAKLRSEVGAAAPTGSTEKSPVAKNLPRPANRGGNVIPPYSPGRMVYPDYRPNDLSSRPFPGQYGAPGMYPQYEYIPPEASVRTVDIIHAPKAPRIKNNPSGHRRHK